MKKKLMLGDNIESLKKMPDNSVDSVVTDPPYGLSFMNKKWDYDVPSIEFWKEVYRVLKPGGHVLSFGGTRTYHRMVVNIEDAGFEIRDQIQWIYGSGFPKSHNIGKAVEGQLVNGNSRYSGNKMETDVEIDKKGGLYAELGDRTMAAGVGAWSGKTIKVNNESAKKWEGWGTALKPANEPICVARKPLSEKSVAENVLKWGTGGINVDGCRVGSETIISRPGMKPGNFQGVDSNSQKQNELITENEGRFPANIILECICDEVIKGEKGEVIKSGGSRDGLDITHDWGYSEIKRTTFTDKGDTHTDPNCPCRLLDEQSGDSISIKLPIKEYDTEDSFKKTGKTIRMNNYSDKGGASRFFYQAKVSKAERNMGLDLVEGKEVIRQGLAGEHNNPIHKNSHPTVKPINLMAYLCRLITPEGGIVLDPFMGSGSTGISAQLEGFRFIGMEMDKDYFKIAETRIDSYEKYNKFIK